MKRLEASSGQVVTRDELARISPLLHVHVIPSETYHFERASVDGWDQIAAFDAKEVKDGRR